MIKRIGKLKQKKGAVLFVVIAIMTLLIAMASTAYYTARGAHNTVVSNYNYSQLYMSAISVGRENISEVIIEIIYRIAAHIRSGSTTSVRLSVCGKFDLYNNTVNCSIDNRCTAVCEFIDYLLV